MDVDTQEFHMSMTYTSLSQQRIAKGKRHARHDHSDKIFSCYMIIIIYKIYIYIYIYVVGPHFFIVRS